ncbi:MAG TPA: alpha/beta fold hydrolase, partial [Chloroflexi bacterium]|nr:alpha/beta fold hydrolase [Chloroflexota bacterium]
MVMVRHKLRIDTLFCCIILTLTRLLEVMSMVAQWLQNPHLDGASFELAGGPTGVLLSHGFTATTTEMRLLAEFLHAHGCTVAAPLLPGHGTSPHEMNRCRWTDWLAALTRAYQALRARCSRVFVGGESMGGALALYLATQQPEVAGVLTYAPALGVASSRREQLLVRWGSWWIPFRRKGPYAPTHTDAYWQGYTVYPLRAVIQLLRFQAALRTRLPLVRQPLLIVQGRLDDT